MKFVI